MGLSDEKVYEIDVDNLGNLWISSKNKIIKYDGYTFEEVFSFESFNSSFKSTTLIDKQGDVWISINLHNKGQAIHYTYSNGKLNSSLDFLKKKGASFDLIQSVRLRENYIVLDTDQGIYSYNGNLELKNSVFLNEIPFKDLDPIREYYIKTKNRKSTVHYYGIDSQKPPIILKDKSYLKMILDGDILYLDCKNQCIKSLSDTTWVLIRDFEDTSMNNSIHDFLYRRTKIVDKFAISSKKLYRRIEDRYEINEDFKNVRFNDISSYKNLLYLATDFGIIAMNTSQNLTFKNFGQSKTINSARAIIVEEGFMFYSENFRNKTKIDPTIFFNLNTEALDTLALVSHYYQDPMDNKTIWACSGDFDRYLLKINLSQSKIKYTRSSNSPSFFIRSPKTNILFGGGKNFFGVVNEKENSIEKSIRLDSIFSSEVILNSAIPFKDKILIASNIGILVLDENETQSALSELSHDLSEINVQFIHLDQNNPDLLWLASENNGLLLFNTETNESKSWTTKNGLKSNTVHFIHQDTLNRLWLSTNNLLHSFDPSTEQFIYFSEDDGLPHNEFNRSAHFWDDRDSTLYLGGLNGYTSFKPNEAISPKKNIDLRVLNIDIYENGKKIRTLNDLQPNDTIRLFENEDFIELTLSSDQLYKVSEYTYYYKLAELNTEWSQQKNQILKLIKPAYGDYTLELIANLNEPSRETHLFPLKIEVIRPFYKTAWFIALCAFAFILSIYLYIKRRLFVLQKQNEALEIKVSERTQTLKTLIKTKTQLFTILSHDLRSPIRNISLFSNKVESLVKENNYPLLLDLASESSAQLDALNLHLQNILIWGTNELGELDLRLKLLDLQDEFSKALTLYSHQIEKKNLKIDFKLDQNYPIKSDQRILQLILRNVIDNAIKFSDSSGVITIRIDEIEDDLIVSIKNSVVQPSKPIEQIIPDMGVGMGLTLSRQLAARLDIEIDYQNVSNRQVQVSIFFKGYSDSYL